MLVHVVFEWPFTLGKSSASNGIIADIRVDGSRLRFFILEVNDFPEKENFQNVSFNHHGVNESW